MNGITWAGVAAVGIGAAAGSLLRWWLAVMFNALLPALPLGTLLANLGGGLAIGVLVGYFNQHVELPPEWRLFAITGILGGLTTFSTFSAEAFMLFNTGRSGWALLHIGTHVAGAIGLCALGYALYRAFS